MSQLTNKYLKEGRGYDFYGIWGNIGSGNMVKIDNMVKDTVKSFDMYRTTGKHQMLAYYIIALLDEKGWTQEMAMMKKMLSKQKGVDWKTKEKE